MSASPSPRLVSLLSSIEKALVSYACPSINSRPERVVNFQKGVARMTFTDGSGSITLQSFTLADGQICVKAEFYWAQTQKTGTYSVYPATENFEWYGAAVRLGEAWMNGLPEIVEPEEDDSRAEMQRAG
jgi:hypothetical protein